MPPTRPIPEPPAEPRPRSLGPNGGPLPATALPELWQTEWCPASRRVRERLTELGVDHVVRQVPAEKADRGALLRATGTDTIPVLVTPDGRPVVGEEAIRGYLDASVAEPAEADAHRSRAARARLRYLEAECGCPPPRTVS